MPKPEQIAKASTLLEALPYLQDFRGKTFLIKVGGSAMENPGLVESLLRDIVFLEAVGINPVLVHGGGKAISAAMAEAGLEPNFIGGLRVTDEKAIAIVSRTLCGVINPGLVETINQLGGDAVGISGDSVFIGRRLTPPHPETGEPVDLGHVGQVCGFNDAPLQAAISEGIVPVLSPLARDEESGSPLNVNADLAASALAVRLGVEKLIYLSDVRGVLRDPASEESLVSTLDEARIVSLIDDGTISGGMIPKVRSALDALHAGVGKVHLIDGRIPHSLVLEIFTEDGIGTQILLEHDNAPSHS